MTDIENRPPVHARETFHKLARAIATEHQIMRVDCLFSQRRHPGVVRARDHLLAVIRWSSGLSYPEIGAIFGMDHTSVMAAVSRHDRRLNGGKR